MNSQALDIWDIQGTASYVVGRCFKCVTLQFPDELLEHASDVYATLQTALQAQDACIKVRRFIKVTPLATFPAQALYCTPTNRLQQDAKAAEFSDVTSCHMPFLHLFQACACCAVEPCTAHKVNMLMGHLAATLHTLQSKTHKRISLTRRR
jgi:hypothetical protein